MKLAVAMAVAASAAVGALKLAARQGSRLGRVGATSRKGPRTGAVEVNPAVVNARVEQLLRTMQPCWSRKEGTFLQPIEVAEVNPVTVRDAGTGRPRTVKIAIAPQVKPSGNIGGGFLATENIDGRITQTVVVTPNAIACGKVPIWRSLFRDVLTHELAHATDPIPVRQARGQHKHRWNKPGSPAYYNSSTEMVAHLAEVQDQLLRFGSEVDWSKRPDQVLEHSPKYADISPFLTPKNRKRFYKMAARLKLDRARDPG